MNKYSVDFDKLNTILSPKKKAYRLEDVQGRIEKVAFDVVRFREDDGISSLWQIEDTDEGKVIVALYDGDNSELKSGNSTPEWSAVADRQANIQIFKGKTAIAKIAASRFGVSDDQADLVCSWLPGKLASDETFREAFLNWITK